MTAWREKFVDELPKLEDRDSMTIYTLPDGTSYVPDSMFSDREPTCWITEHEFWDGIERKFGQVENRPTNSEDTTF